jgi:ribonuclease P protein component
LQRIAREGKRIRTTHLEVRAAASPLAHSNPESPGVADAGMRVGLIVPKYKQSGVARNRLKRRLRELARIRLLPTGLSVDVVIRVRPEAYLATFEALTNDVTRVLAQLVRWHETTSAARPRDTP